MSFSANMYEFTKTEYDPQLVALNNSIDNILSNAVIKFRMPSTNQMPDAGTVYNREYLEFNKQGAGAVPLITVRLTEDGNVWSVDILGDASETNYITGKKYKYSRMQYYDTYESPEEIIDDAEESLLSDLYRISDEHEADADNCWIYLYTYWVDNYEPPFFLESNLPIVWVDEDFDEEATDVLNYLNHTITINQLVESNEHILEIINKPVIEDAIKTVGVVSIAKEATWDYNTYTYTNSPVKCRGYRITYDLNECNISQYIIPGITTDEIESSLRIGINITGQPIKVEYTYDGENWTTSVSGELTFRYIYRERDKENGTFYSAISNYIIGDPLYTFGTKAESDDYNIGEIDEKNAIDWGEQSGKIPPKNSTEYDDDFTEWGSVYTRAFFSQQYIVNTTTLQEICNGLYDVSPNGIWENIKKGIEMYGQNPMESVGSLMFYPVDLTSVLSASTVSAIWFGGYQFDITSGGICKKIDYPNGYKDFGTFTIKPTYNNFRDYEPYQKLRVYLPYIGWNELDIKKYMNKQVTVRYFFDTRTGMCLATLASGVVLDYFSGQCGVSMPITLTDFSRYAQTQIQALLGGGGEGFNNVTGAVQGASQMAMGGAAIGASVAMGGLGVAMGGGIAASKTAFSLTQNHINNYNRTKGASSSMLNQYLPQEVCFEFEVMEGMETDYERELIGYPSNASGSIASFAGYLEVDSVNLVCSGATERERQEIISLLHNGIYI